ncbi:MAG: hypothetical protein MZU97_17740 [Bacillus subtilis]|nr:hypothetical protein [Bacillus subtilis]
MEAWEVLPSRRIELLNAEGFAADLANASEQLNEQWQVDPDANRIEAMRQAILSQ